MATNCAGRERNCGRGGIVAHRSVGARLQHQRPILLRRVRCTVAGEQNEGGCNEDVRGWCVAALFLLGTFVGWVFCQLVGRFGVT